MIIHVKGEKLLTSNCTYNKCYTQPSVANVVSNLVNQVVEELSKVEGLSKILVAEHGAYKGFLPGNQENLKLLSNTF